VLKIELGIERVHEFFSLVDSENKERSLMSQPNPKHKRKNEVKSMFKQTVKKINFKAVIFGFPAEVALRDASLFYARGDFLGSFFSLLSFLFFVVQYLRLSSKPKETEEKEVENDYEPNLIFLGGVKNE